LASVSALDATERWREVVQGPTRIAILANQDAGQADAAVRRLERWLPPTNLGDQCPERVASEPPRPGVQPLKGGRDAAATGIFGVAFEPEDRRFAELTRAWLMDPQGPLRSALRVAPQRLEVEVVSGAGRAALAVLLQTSRAGIEGAREGVQSSLEGLATKPPDEAAHERAVSSVQARQLGESSRPANRLLRLWRRRTGAEPPDHDEWVAWLAKHFRPEGIISVSEHLPEPEATGD
jgi:hypothetical protein